MIILGIDQGIATFGFGIVDINDFEIKIIDSGHYKTPAKHSTGKRLNTLNNNIEELLKIYTPELISCERLFYNAPSGGRNKSLGMMYVNMATGMIEMLADRHGLEVAKWPPTTVKKMLTGNGRASKEEVNQFISKYLTKEIKVEHEADAIAIAITAYYKRKEEDHNAEQAEIKNGEKAKGGKTA